MGYGLAGKISLAKEATWDTPVSPTDTMEALSESLTLGIDRFETRNIINGVYEPNDMAGVRRIVGDIVAAVHPVTAGHFLAGALGINSITVVLSGFLWTTKFFPNTTDAGTTNPLTPYTYYVFRDVTCAHRYSGVQVARLQLAVSPNQPVIMTAGVMARQTSVTGLPSGAAPTSPADPFAFDTTSLSLGGASTALMEALTVSIDHQLEGVPSLNNATIVRAFRRRPPTQIRVSGTLSFENLTEYNNFVQQTEQALTVSFFRAASFSLTVLIPRIVYTAHPLGVPGRDRLLTAFEARANFDPGSARSIQIDLTTTKSDY